MRPSFGMGGHLFLLDGDEDDERKEKKLFFVLAEKVERHDQKSGITLHLSLRMTTHLCSVFPLKLTCFFKSILCRGSSKLPTMCLFLADRVWNMTVSQVAQIDPVFDSLAL